MSPLFFCNIGWMNRYEGLEGKPDKIVGGGKWVADNKSGHEVCNFAVADDGFIYGHVETIKGRRDRRIQLDVLGRDAGEFIDGVDVVWTATDPEAGGRKVVGWYRNATVFRERQSFVKAPSKQHARDKINTYRIQVRAKNAYRLELDERNLSLGRGPGWMGHTPWWTPKPNAAPEILRFTRHVRRLIDSGADSGHVRSNKNTSSKSPSAAADPYQRYVEAYETKINPRHNRLQKQFEVFLRGNAATDLRPNVGSADLRYRDMSKRLILAEVKPCDVKNARYAIRTAIGQLLDYRQKCEEATRLLIVIEKTPNNYDRDLALSNGFGIAYPDEIGFQTIWPNQA